MLNDVGFHVYWVDIWFVEPKDVSFGVDKELREIPRNLLRLFLIFVPKSLWVASQMFVEFMCTFAVDLYFLEHWELDLLALYKFIYLGIITVLLHEELVTGEGEDLEASVPKLVVDLN